MGVFRRIGVEKYRKSVKRAFAFTGGHMTSSLRVKMPHCVWTEGETDGLVHNGGENTQVHYSASQDDAEVSKMSECEVRLGSPQACGIIAILAYTASKYTYLVYLCFVLILLYALPHLCVSNKVLKQNRA